MLNNVATASVLEVGAGGTATATCSPGGFPGPSIVLTPEQLGFASPTNPDGTVDGKGHFTFMEYVGTISGGGVTESSRHFSVQGQINQPLAFCPIISSPPPYTINFDGDCDSSAIEIFRMDYGCLTGIALSNPLTIN